MDATLAVAVFTGVFGLGSKAIGLASRALPPGDAEICAMAFETIRDDRLNGALGAEAQAELLRRANARPRLPGALTMAATFDWAMILALAAAFVAVAATYARVVPSEKSRPADPPGDRARLETEIERLRDDQAWLWRGIDRLKGS